MSEVAGLRRDPVSSATRGGERRGTRINSNRMPAGLTKLSRGDTGASWRQLPQVQATGDVARSTQFSSRFMMGKTIAGRKE